jgi:hypothetical protein
MQMCYKLEEEGLPFAYCHTKEKYLCLAKRCSAGDYPTLEEMKELMLQ